MEGQNNNATTSAIREKLWAAKLFVKIEVPEHYISSEQPKPIYKVLFRNTYLEFHYESVNELFKPYTIGSEMWFGFDEKPLHWHVPFGVLVDTYHGVDPKLPIELSAHYRTPPFEKIICNNVKLGDVPANAYPLIGLKTTKDHFNHSLKEATQIRYGSTNAIMRDTKAEEYDQIFEVIKSDYMEKYEKIFNKIWFNPKHKMKAMPLRVFIKNYENIIQKSVAVADEEGKENTLGDSLKKIFPKIKFHWDEAEENERKFQVISHGVLLEPEYPISFLADTFYSLDGFVYISLYCED